MSDLKVHKRLLRKVAWRSFLLQALWNYKKMQNVGWAWAVVPFLEKMYPDPEKRREALKAHLEYFNTNPYMAGVVLGTTLRMEEELLKRGEDPRATVAALKMGLMGPLAALGDVLFWATLRPLAALAGVGLYFMGGSNTASAIGGAVLLLLLFNGPHMVARFAGPLVGWVRGREIIGLLRRLDVPRLVSRSHLGGLIVLAAVIASLGRFRYVGVETAMPLRDNLLFLGSGALMLTALRFKVRAPYLMVLLAFVALLAGAFEPLPQLVKP